MKRPYQIIYPLAAYLLAGCQSLDLPATPEPAMQGVTIDFCCDPMDAVSRTLTAQQENTLRDVNLYLYAKNTDVSRHVYASGSGSVTIANLPNGTYELQAVANAGKDLGKLTRTALEALRLTVAKEADLESALPMTARQDVTVKGPTSVTVRMKRRVAKVTLSVTVAASFASQFTLQSARIFRVPKVLSYFRDNVPTVTTDCMDYARAAVTGNRYTTTRYMPENLQGIKTTITSQSQRNRANAPVCATCLLLSGQITATKEKVDYYVFLGSNNTTDFNIRGNGQYSYNITITGKSTVDTRVSTAAFALTTFASSYNVNEKASSTLTLSTANHTGNNLYLAYRIAEGSGQVAIDGTMRPVNTPYLFSSGAGKTAAITYTQASAGNVRLVFTLSDDYGSSIERELTTVYRQGAPIQTNVSALSEPTAHKTGSFTLSLAENGYTGNFTVAYAYVSGNDIGAVTFNGQNVAAGNALTLKSGSHTFQYTASKTGQVRMRFTICDSYGQSQQADFVAEIAPLVIDIRPVVTWYYYTYAVSRGYIVYRKADLSVTADMPVRTAIDFKYKLNYRLRRISDGDIIDRSVPMEIYLYQDDKSFQSVLFDEQDLAPVYSLPEMSGDLITDGYLFGSVPEVVFVSQNTGGDVTVNYRLLPFEIKTK